MDRRFDPEALAILGTQFVDSRTAKRCSKVLAKSIDSRTKNSYAKVLAKSVDSRVVKR